MYYWHGLKPFSQHINSAFSLPLLEFKINMPVINCTKTYVAPISNTCI